MGPDSLNTLVSTTFDNLRFKHLLCALLMVSIAVIAQRSQATPQSPTVFVETIFAELTDDFRSLSSTPSTNQIETLFKEKLTPHIDFQGLARWVLREHWENSQEIQKDAFLVALQKHLIKTYAAALSFDDSISLTINEHVKSGKRLTQVTGTLKSNESVGTEVLFRLVEDKTSWQIFDVGVHGISVAKTLRADISAIAGHGGIDAVTAALTSGNFKLVSQR